MKKIYLFFFLFIFLVSIVTADDWPLCIDTIKPSEISGLFATGNVQLTWNAATDEPEATDDCNFGINYYNIYLDGDFLDTSELTSYTANSLADGTYTFGVSAVDKGGNEGPITNIEVTPGTTQSTTTTTTIQQNSGGGNGGGGGGGGSGSSTPKTDSFIPSVIEENQDDQSNQEENTETEGSNVESITGRAIGEVEASKSKTQGILIALVIVILGSFAYMKLFKKEPEKSE